MPTLDTLFAFIAVSVAITLAPGPDNLMVLGQSLARGRAAGVGIAAGCALGCFTHTLWATLGVSALLVASPTAFFALKLAGALYLIWLGIQAFRGEGTLGAPTAEPARPLAWRRYVARGFIANAVNPKVALFFLAFLPQFVRPESGSAALQMLVLGATFAAQTVLVFGAIALTAGAVGRVLARRPRMGPWLDRASGVVFLGLAANLLLDERRG